MDQFPASFRYYDPILAIIQENISTLKKEMVYLKEKVAYGIYQKSDMLHHV